MIKPLSVHEFKQWQNEKRPYQLIDVREPWERDICKLDNDRHVTLSQILRAPDNFPRDLPLVFYCHHGARSKVAATQVENEGFNDLYNLEGGIDAWSAEIDRTIPTY